MRRPLIAGNWKMNGSLSICQSLLSDLSCLSDFDKTEFAVFPPYVYLPNCIKQLQDSVINCGAQDVSEFSDGAYTGEVSASMLDDLGCKYVIIGHSERRQLFGDTNESVAKKCKAAFYSSLIPIVCVGETLLQREKGLTLQIVQEQLEVILLLKDNCANFSQLVVAYEPVWAIGTGKSATPYQAQEVHLAIRNQLAAVDQELADKVRVLYGGSVKPSNAKALFAMPDIDGALVGGASLDAEQFIEIGRICNKLY